MTIKYAPYPGKEAVKRAKARVGQAIYTGMCQAFTVTMFGTGAVGDYDGDRDADAVDGWKAAKKRVHAKDIHDYSRIPAGVALYWSGGSRGYGHAAVSIGGGKMVTTDFAAGRVGIADIRGWWSRSHTFLGYVTQEGNGHILTDPPKKRRHRIATWNVKLLWSKNEKKPSAKGLTYRLGRITRKIRRVKPDVLMVQERPQNPGKRMDGKMGNLTRRVGKYARYIYFHKRAVIHGWSTWDPWPKHKTITKWVTSATVSLDGIKRFYVNCHPISGPQYRLHRERWARAVIVKAIRKADRMGVEREEMIFGGDFQGGEFAKVAKDYGFVRARSYSAWKTLYTRTFNKFGKHKKTTEGGQYDYILIHVSKAKKKTVKKYWNFWTYIASDHNLVMMEVEE